MADSKRLPPRWFMPVLFVGMLLAVAGLVGLGALLYEPAQRPIAIGERTYLVPPAEISSFTRDPHLFIRIRPSGLPFEIVHDGRGEGRRDRAGLPHIFSVNDEGDQGLRYDRVERSPVVCRRASSPAGGCGTWIRYGGVAWSILFPESRVGDADRFARRAAALLKTYDTSVRGLLP